MGEKAANGLRITNQFRSKNGFSYDLKLDETRMTLNISPRESPSDEGEWRVDAEVRRTSETTVITGWGPTRADAVRQAGRSWASKTYDLALPTFDWEAIVRILSEVRAV